MKTKINFKLFEQIKKLIFSKKKNINQEKYLRVSIVFLVDGVIFVFA